MNKTEKLNKLNTYSVFRLYNEISGVYTINEKVSYSEILKEISLEKKYWTKVDDENNIINGYGESYQNILDNLQSLLDERNYIFNSEQEFTQFIGNHYTMSNNRQRGVRETYEFTIKIKMLSCKDSLIPIIKSEYIRLLKLDKPEALNKLIDLFKKRTSIYSVVNSTGNNDNEDSTEALVSYIGLKTKNTTKVNFKKEVLSELDVLKDEILNYNEIFNNTKSTLFSETLEYQQNLEAWEKEKELWYDAQELRLAELEVAYTKKQNELEVTYAEKLRLEKPASFWKTETEKKRRAFRINLGVTCVLSLIVLWAGQYLVSTLYKFAISDTFNKQFIPFSFVMVALITFLIYLLRMSIKIMLSSKHLQTEYEQKRLFTEFYLCLLNDSKVKPDISETEKNLIYQNLFSNPDSGLIKTNSDTNELMTLITAMISKK